MDVRGRRVTVMGLGHFGGGLAAARWAAEQQAIVTLSDAADAPALAEPLSQLAGVPIAAMHLGGHCAADFDSADLLIVNPAVRPTNPWLALAAGRGIPITTEIGLFIECCPAQVVGVTGSNGKSTTAAMTAAILRAAGRRTWLGGNLGGSLLPQLAGIRSNDWVVLELSSFQLWHLPAGTPMPQVAVVTNFAPNHLDWHGTLDHYRAAKQRLIAEQDASGVAVHNPFDCDVTRWRPLAAGRVAEPWPLEQVPKLSVPGGHNRQNAALAAAAARAVGCERAAIERGLAGFTGLPQRLERCAVVAGRQFYNDSTATTPDSAIAALVSLPEPAWLLAGGRTKGCDFGPLAAVIVRRARGAAFYGECRAELQRLVLARQPDFPCMATERLDEALAWCFAQSAPGEAIVLSPGCASTDQYQNFRQRGKRFVELADRLLYGNGPAKA
jgi:UDP-N-acetylmuramoylalanine--D-glutamate ligase